MPKSYKEKNKDPMDRLIYNSFIFDGTPQSSVTEKKPLPIKHITRSKSDTNSIIYRGTKGLR